VFFNELFVLVEIFAVNAAKLQLFFDIRKRVRNFRVKKLFFAVERGLVWRKNEKKHKKICTCQKKAVILHAFSRSALAKMDRRPASSASRGSPLSHKSEICEEPKRK
jgi:hypothetical protein